MWTCHIHIAHCAAHAMYICRRTHGAGMRSLVAAAPLTMRCGTCTRWPRDRTDRQITLSSSLSPLPSEGIITITIVVIITILPHTHRNLPTHVPLLNRLVYHLPISYATRPDTTHMSFNCLAYVQVFIGNIPSNIAPQWVIDKCNQFGQVINGAIWPPAASGKRCGVIAFRTEPEAIACIEGDQNRESIREDSDGDDGDD